VPGHHAAFRNSLETDFEKELRIVVSLKITPEFCENQNFVSREKRYDPHNLEEHPKWGEMHASIDSDTVPFGASTKESHDNILGWCRLNKSSNSGDICVSAFFAFRDPRRVCTDVTRILNLAAYSKFNEFPNS
jgi:hypothetical protein